MTMINLDFSIDSVLKKFFSKGKKPSTSRFSELFQNLSILENQNKKNLPTIADNNNTDKNNLEIVLNKIRKGQDKRSTIIIKGIPSFLSSDEAYSLVKRFYDNINFFYIPSYIKNQKKYMYAFINVQNYKGIINIYNGIMKLKQQYPNNSGVNFSQLELFYSRTQGKSALINKYMSEIV